MARNFRVVRAAELPEGSNSVLLADLESDDRAAGQILDDWLVLGQHTLVDLKELLHNGTVEVEELHGANLEPSLQDHVEHLASLALPLYVRLDQAESAVVENRRCLHGTSVWHFTCKPKIMLSLVAAD